VFRTGDTIPRSGIYRVSHFQHRLPHEVTLLRGEIFPRCSKCHDEVKFRVVRLVAAGLENKRDNIVLHELPAMDEREAA
jgi:hypothetical protein